jgi:leader peptidase (prepilin peptidase)/N-methyltransferase
MTDGVLAGLIATVVLIIGASVGSFLNVVIYRLPAGISLVSPGSRCPKCYKALRPYDNVPVLGWLWLQGKCRFCRSPISPRYPLVEVTAGILFVLVLWQFGLSWQMLGYCVLLSWLLALALIDLDTLTLPNALTQTGLVAGLVFQMVAGGLQGGTAGSAAGLMGAIAAAVLGIWLFDAIILVGSVAFGQTAMGGGDAKLAAMLGAWLGWKLLLLSGFLACVLGAFVGGGAIALGLLSRRQPMPFGPFLALGAVICVFWGQAILSAYLRVFFPTL